MTEFLVFPAFETLAEICTFSVIYLRVRKRNDRKCVTIVEGLGIFLDEKQLGKFLRIVRQDLHTNGTVVNGILQVQGDVRTDIAELCIRMKVCTIDNILMHGF
jgi:translation initiation factor SUI1